MNIFKQFYRSLFSPRDIASYRTQGVGKTVVYLILLTIIASIPTLYYMTKGINEAIHTFTMTLEEEVPDFSISNNTLVMDEKEPTIIEKSDITIVVDSTGTYDPSRISSYGNSVALLKNEFVIVTAGQTQMMDYSSFGNLTLTKDEVVSFLESMDTMSTIIITLIVVTYILFMIIYKTFQTLILAIFGNLFSKIFGRTLSYTAIWKITVYSTTIPVIFFAIMDSLQTVVPFGAILNWFISLFLVCLVIKEIPLENSPKNKE